MHIKYCHSINIIKNRIHIKHRYFTDSYNLNNDSSSNYKLILFRMYLCHNSSLNLSVFFLCKEDYTIKYKNGNL